MPTRLYFELSGETFRVHDTAFTAGKHKVLPLGDPGAHHRVFVTRSGSRRLYRFKKGELHMVTEELLERQLRAAEFGASGGFDASEHRGR